MNKYLRSTVSILAILLLFSISGLVYLGLRYHDLRVHYDILLQDLQQAHDQLAEPAK